MQKGGWVSPADSSYIDMLLNVSTVILHGSVVPSQCPDIDLRILLILSRQLPMNFSATSACGYKR